jgi:hypothetical protein
VIDDGGDAVVVGIRPIGAVFTVRRSLRRDPDGICVSTASCGLAPTSATQFVVAEEEEAIRVRVKVVRDDPVLEDKWRRVRPRR